MKKEIRGKKDKTHRVVVEIFGINFPLKTDEPERLIRLAKEVDTRMKTMAREVNSFDGVKIAILAALALAHDHDELKQSYDDFVKLLDEEQ